ncbi:MAG: helix-hairpin-helix domain-containing protein [Bacteroidetes bacterium]|nr:helix-hairpin-helix domain-containing protein [Bacteroidota bacterium]
MKMKKVMTGFNRIVGEYLTYNRSEQRGILVLCLILLGLIITNAVIPSGTLQKSPDFSILTKEAVEFEAAWQKAADSDSIARVVRYSRKYNQYFKSKQDSSGYKKAPAKPPLLIELNSADTFDLQQLRGIGPAFARRIVSYRERLRGFSNKNQLLEVFGMDSLRFRAIETNLTVNTDSVQTIDMNTVTFKELLRHPYFPFPVTKNIIVYRQKHKAFKSVEEIKNIEGISDSLFRRIIVYLRVGP